MEDSLLHALYVWFKKFSPYILVGVIGAVVHRLRTEMSLRAFLASLVIAILVSLSVGVVCQEHTNLSPNTIFVLCGISGTFSKLLLDEIEEVIGDFSFYFKQRMGVENRKKSKDTGNNDKTDQDVPEER